MKTKITLNIDEVEKSSKIFHALASPARLKILQLIEDKPLNISKISTLMNIPMSSTALAINILEDAGLVITTSSPGLRGSQKLCALKTDSIYLQIKKNELPGENTNVIIEQIPIGNYFDFSVEPPCGIVTSDGFISAEDSVYGFYAQEHSFAQLLWLTRGFVEYRFPTYRLKNYPNMKSIEFSFELCSEAPGYCNDWKSDIAVYFNGTHIGFVHSLGDFGNRRGLLNPDWWDHNNTQYGLIHSILITATGTLIDDQPVSDFNLNSLNIGTENSINLRLAVDSTSHYKGGMNLFGEKFGDYSQNIRMKAIY